MQRSRDKIDDRVPDSFPNETPEIEFWIRQIAAHRNRQPYLTIGILEEGNGQT
jgi:hypothetical protein